jgi:hypothetical protein
MTTILPTRRNAGSLARACAWLICIAASGLAGCAAQPTPVAAPIKHGWTMDEVSDSYLFGYPLVVMTSARAAASAPGGSGVNTLNRARALPAAGVPGLLARVDADMLSSFAWLDLAAEPVLVTLPATHGEYMDARALDLWTNVVWSKDSIDGARERVDKAQTFVFVPPGWRGELPTGVERIDAPGKSLWLRVSIAATAPRELAAARRLQDEVGVITLSAFDAGEHSKHVKHAKRTRATGRVPGTPERTERARAAGADDRPDLADTPAAQAVPVASLDAPAFFGRLADALRDNPPSPADPHALAILADFGVKPGEPVRLPDDAGDAIARGLADGRGRVVTAPRNALSANGWSWLGDGVGEYGEDYALRAYAAYSRPGSGTKHGEVVAMASVDAHGRALSGGEHYVLHFPAKALPPARAFWTLTAYTKDGALVDGCAADCSIASRDGLRRNRDGSLDIYVQASSPGRERRANWLPAPKGAYEIVMRLYAPQPSATDGTWLPPALARE